MRYIINKLSKKKDKESWKQQAYQIQMILSKSIHHFSKETLEARKQWADIFKVLEEKKLATKNILPSKAVPKKWRSGINFPS